MKKHRYTKEFLEPLVASSKSVQEICRKLGLRGGSTNRHIRKKIDELKIDASHFSGNAWNRGKRLPKFPDELVFCEHSTFRSELLRKRMAQTGWWEYRCEICKIVEWMEEPLVLHVDHINGIHDDNRRENLRYLCPNCHQQTDTWGHKQRK